MLLEYSASDFSRKTLFTLARKASNKERLAACRQQIDSFDRGIVKLIQEPARVAEEVGRLKREAYLAVTVPSRDQQVIAKAQELAKGGPRPSEASVGRISQKLVHHLPDEHCHEFNL
jgi:chorismate mutase